MRDRLIGGWTLDDWRVSYGDGRPETFPFGPDATGMLVYAPDGTMHGCMARAGRKPLSAESAKFAPAEERLAAFDSYFSYGGTWTVAADTVTHHVTVALNQNLVGTHQVRRMHFAGDTLTLAADDKVPGSDVDRHHALTWRRIRAGS